MCLEVKEKKQKLTAIKNSSYLVELRVLFNWTALYDERFEIYTHGRGQKQVGVQVDICGEVMEGEKGKEREKDYTYKL